MTDVLMANGYSKEEAEKLVTDRRDYLCDCDIEPFELGDNLFHFNAATETAGSPNMEPWFDMLKDKYNNEIELLYMSEECGNLIYETNDKNAEVYTDRYVINYFIKGEGDSHYFSNKGDLVDYISEVFHIPVSLDESVEELQDDILRAEGIKDDADNFCYVNEFAYVDRAA